MSNLKHMFLDYNPISISSKYINWFFSGSAGTVIKKPTPENINSYQLLIFSMNGVLRNNDKAIPLAVETFNKLKNEMNKKICIITNECRYSPKRIKKELRSLGFNIDNDIDVITASSLTLIALTNILKWRHVSNSSGIQEETESYSSKYISRKRYRKIVNSSLQTQKQTQTIVSSTKFGIISDPELFSYLKNSITKKYHNVLFYHIKVNHPIPKDLDYVVIGTLSKNNQEENKEEKQEEKHNINSELENAFQWFKSNPKVSIILANSNIQPDHREINYLEPINLLKEIEKYGKNKDKDFELPIDQIAVGKPYCSEFIDKFIERYNLTDSKDKLIDSENSPKSPKLKVLMVGDDYNSDIKFAENINCDKCLVLTGNTRLEDLNNNNNIDTSSINYIIPDVSYLAL